MANEAPEPNWTYSPDAENSPQSPSSQPTAEPQITEPNVQPPAQSSVSWTASEFVSNHKDPRWFFLFFLALAACLAATYFFTKDVFTVITIAIVGVLFVIIANRKPRQLPYAVDSQGVTIANKFHPYGLFKSFSLSSEGVIGCINFIPLKRFMPEISIYFPPEEGENIINIISEHLPNDQKAERNLDKFARKIRF